MSTVRFMSARVDVPALEEQMTAGFASAGLPDDPALEQEIAEQHGWDSCPIYSPAEEAEMYDLWCARSAELAELGHMAGEPRVA
jgi:hypothetical protein